VRYENFGKMRKPVSITPGTFDPLSVFYAFRVSTFKRFFPPRRRDRWKEMRVGTARIVEKQTVQVPCGQFETFVVEPDLKDVGGVFKRAIMPA